MRIQKLLWLLVLSFLLCYSLPELDEDRRGSLFSTRLYEPFQHVDADENCGEPVYCSHTVEMQHRLWRWQHLDPADCGNSKFLVYSPPSQDHGIGSMIQIIGHVFRQALCLGRRLYLLPSAYETRSLSRWKHVACSNESSSIECYFERVTSCHLSTEEILNAPKSQKGFGIHAYPLRNSRVVRLIGLPAEGPW